jgi:hypothetical protein
MATRKQLMLTTLNSSFYHIMAIWAPGSYDLRKSQIGQLAMLFDFELLCIVEQETGNLQDQISALFHPLLWPVSHAFARYCMLW